MMDMLLMLVVLGAINHQATHILTVGVIFQDFRNWVSKTFGHESKLAYLVRCHLCAGTWVGFGIAILAPGAIQLTHQPVVNGVLVAFAVALTGRIFNEGLALMSSKVSEIRARATVAAEGGPTMMNAPLPTRTDLLVEIGNRLLVTSFTPRGDRYLTAFWRDAKVPGEANLYVLLTALLDPIISQATKEGLTVLVRPSSR